MARHRDSARDLRSYRDYCSALPFTSYPATLGCCCIPPVAAFGLSTDHTANALKTSSTLTDPTQAMEPRMALILWVIANVASATEDNTSNLTLSTYDTSFIAENISLIANQQNTSTADVINNTISAHDETTVINLVTSSLFDENQNTTNETQINQETVDSTPEPLDFNLTSYFVTETVKETNESEMTQPDIHQDGTTNFQNESEEFPHLASNLSTVPSLINISEEEESSGDGLPNETPVVVVSHVTDSSNMFNESGEPFFNVSDGFNLSSVDENMIEGKTEVAGNFTNSESTEEVEVLTQQVKFGGGNATKAEDESKVDFDNVLPKEAATSGLIAHMDVNQTSFHTESLDSAPSNVYVTFSSSPLPDLTANDSTTLDRGFFVDPVTPEDYESTEITPPVSGEVVSEKSSLSVATGGENRTGKMIPTASFEPIPSVPDEGDTRVIFEPENTSPVSAEVFTETSKHHEDLTDDEYTNAVTVIFTAPEESQMDVYWYEGRNRKFREFVVNSVNIQDATGWPHLNYEGISTFEKYKIEWVRKRRSLYSSLKPDDLIYIAPSPMAEHRNIYVSFFVRNSSTSDPTDVVSSLRLFHAVNASRADLEQQMELNISRIAPGIILVRYVESFFVRHAIIFTAMLAVAVFCICFIIFGLIYIRCKSLRGKWDRNEFGEKSKLNADMRQSRDAGELNPDNEIQNDESQIEKNGRACINGNSMHVIQLSEEEGWVKPFEDGANITPMETRKGTEDTKL